MTTVPALDAGILAEFAGAVGPDGPVAVEGGRTRWSLGGQLQPGARLVRAPTGLVRHVPEEMIATVRAGTPVAELHRALAERGQRTPLPERGGTVGGAVAVGENDLRVLGRGTVRAAVLQVRYVSADGELVTGGGPTVKNVSGFDLPRLLVGSLGTLGCIAEVTLRTNPIPPVSCWFAAADADPFAAFAAAYRPSAVLWDGARTWVQLEGHAGDVSAQLAALRRGGGFEAVDGPPRLPPERWSLPPAELRALDRHDTGRFVAVVGVGLVFAERPQPRRALDRRVRDLTDRMKAAFDPSGRLNPGRDAGSR